LFSVRQRNGWVSFRKEKKKERERETWWRLYVLAMLELRSCFGFSTVRDRKKNRGERGWRAIVGF